MHSIAHRWQWPAIRLNYRRATGEFVEDIFPREEEEAHAHEEHLSIIYETVLFTGIMH